MNNPVSFPTISVIVTTYNWPQALEAVLQALMAQKTGHAFEIIVADDGSRAETAEVIRACKTQTQIPILHIWQPDEGFRAAAIRNKAIVAAEGDYIVFLDGDCIVGQHFIARQGLLSEKGTFVVGNRVLLTPAFTEQVLSQALPVHQWLLWRWALAWLYGQCNRMIPFFVLPLGRLRLLGKQRWRGAKGCNLSVWKSDLLKVNGWEEKFIGWGYEDSDLIIRLLRFGIVRKEGRFSLPVVHLWHPENDRSHEQENWALLQVRQKDGSVQAACGISQYEPESSK